MSEKFAHKKWKTCIHMPKKPDLQYMNIKCIIQHIFSVQFLKNTFCEIHMIKYIHQHMSLFRYIYISYTNYYNII